MQQKNSHIKRMLANYIEINSLITYKQAIKNNIKAVKSLKINFTEGKVLDEASELKARKLFFKVLKKVKPVVKLDITKAQQIKPLDNSKLVHIVKNQSRMKEIRLPILNGDHLWVKYLKNLQKLACIVPTYTPTRYLSKRRNYHSRLLSMIKRHRLISLHMAPKYIYKCETKTTLLIEKYPSTLETLAIDVESFASLKSADLEKLCNFAYLKDLKKLSLSLGGDDKLWEKCLKGIDDADRLESLELQIGKSVRSLPRIAFSEKLLNLKHFYLKLKFLPTGVEDLLLDISRLSLKTFSLDLLDMIDSYFSNFNYSALGKCLENFSSLENLTLKFVVDFDFGESPDFFNKMQTQISKFNFKVLNLCISKNHFSNNKRPTLYVKEILKSSSAIEELSIQTRGFDSDVVVIFSECERFSSTLKKLELSFDFEYHKGGSIDEYYEAIEQVCKSIEVFEKIEVLKLPRISIEDERALEMLSHSVSRFKNLKIYQY